MNFLPIVLSETETQGSGEAGWVALGVVLTGVIGAVVAAVVTYLNARHKINQEDRADTIKEWKETVDALQTITTGLRMRADLQEKDISTLHKEHAKCMVENAQLNGEIRLMQATIQRLQGITGDDMAGSSIPPIIVADMHGKIKQVSPYVTPLLHYMSSELIGKNVEMLVPLVDRERHNSKLKAFRESQSPPWTERVILGNALTKEGSEVPVSITLSAWRDSTHGWLISAEIRRRAVLHTSASPSTLTQPTT